jgi:hypothetical protein
VQKEASSGRQISAPTPCGNGTDHPCFKPFTGHADAKRSLGSTTSGPETDTWGKAQGSIGPYRVATPGRATDSASEQDLEVGPTRRGSLHCRGNTEGRTTKTGGNGEKVSAVVTRRRAGDEGNTSQGRASRERQTKPGCRRRVATRGGGEPVGGSRKRGEPHDRLQGATNLQRTRRSRPSKP